MKQIAIHACSRDYTACGKKTKLSSKTYTKYVSKETYQQLLNAERVSPAVCGSSVTYWCQRIESPCIRTAAHIAQFV